jgi:hypothetical protein
MTQRNMSFARWVFILAVIWITSVSRAAILVPDELEVKTEHPVVIVEVQPSLKEKVKSNQVSVALNLQNYSYSEPLPNIKISGFLPGIEGEFRHQAVGDSAFFTIGGDYTSGQITYDGDLQNGKPLTAPTTEYIEGLHATIGGDLNFRNGLGLESAAGIGYRYLSDLGQSSSSYRREQTYYYVPIIFAVTAQFNNDVSLKVGVEGDIFISGTNVSHLEDANSNYPTLEFHQSSGSGSDLFARVATHLRAIDNNQVYAELSYRNWSIGDSNKNSFYDADKDEMAPFFEPRNTTDSYNLAFGVIF